MSAIATTGIYFAGHLANDSYDIANRLNEGPSRRSPRLYYLPLQPRAGELPPACVTYLLPVDTATFFSGAGYALGWAALFTAIPSSFERCDFR